MSLSADELNFLIYRYLHESGETLRGESCLLRLPGAGAQRAASLVAVFEPCPELLAV